MPVEVWRQALVENAKAVELGAERYPVRLTPKRHLLSEVRYVANVVDAKVTFYGKRAGISC